MEINGIRCIDGTRPLVIEITADDIKEGKPFSEANCATALACKRQIDGVLDARVHKSRVYLLEQRKSKQIWVRYRTTVALRTEIVGFDRSKGQSAAERLRHFHPGTFSIMPVPPRHRFGLARKDKPPRKRNGPSGKRQPHVVSGVRTWGANR